jgi:hypothetical protein
MKPALCGYRPGVVKGNVIFCDECKRQMSMPMEIGAGGKQSLDERVRAWAAVGGWAFAEGKDYCPEPFSA